MKDDRSYARCKACDTQFYPQWIARRKCFEELCHKCLPVAMYAAISDEEYTEEADDIVSRYIEERDLNDDLWKEDDYLAYGEQAMGDLSLFDRS